MFAENRKFSVPPKRINIFVVCYTVRIKNAHVTVSRSKVNDESAISNGQNEFYDCNTARRPATIPNWLLCSHSSLSAKYVRRCALNYQAPDILLIFMGV